MTWHIPRLEAILQTKESNELFEQDAEEPITDYHSHAAMIMKSPFIGYSPVRCD